MKRKTVVLGVTGGVAVYKSLDIVSRLKKKGIDVFVIMTRSAQEFVSELSFRSLSLNPVTIDMFERPSSFEVEHIALAQRADVFLVAPATANIIGKVANGIADDMLSTTIMATKAPVVFVPAMNTNMYLNPINQRNINTLKEFGYHFIDPISGRLACGDVGIGKMESPEVIVDYVEYLLTEKDLLGKNILITAGPTSENIDPVRHITNKSSGKMGYALAISARNRGANVTLITGKTSLPKPNFVDVVQVFSAQQMYNQVMNHLDKADIVIKAAAVSDYKPVEASKNKIKKQGDELTINLIKNKDILYEVGKCKENKILVGFAAETENLIDNAKTKLRAKNLDMIVANDVSRSDSGFDVDTNKVTIITEDSIETLETKSKDEVSNDILNRILQIKR
ncbi:MAG: bifunctional phosphopantothenoylcysteine decarboxylase/phosphopantothenate--cysteine ligase CoaBC [Clostridium sp.]